MGKYVDGFELHDLLVEAGICAKDDKVSSVVLRIVPDDVATFTVTKWATKEQIETLAALAGNGNAKVVEELVEP